MELNFTIYIIIWTILAGVFFLLEKRAKSIKYKKQINITGVVSVFLLMMFFIYFQSNGGSIQIVAVLFILMLAAIFTQYCQQCYKRVNTLGKNISYCPNCGGELKK